MSYVLRLFDNLQRKFSAQYLQVIKAVAGLKKRSILAFDFIEELNALHQTTLPQYVEKLYFNSSLQELKKERERVSITKIKLKLTVKV